MTMYCLKYYDFPNLFIHHACTPSKNVCKVLAQPLGVYLRADLARTDGISDCSAVQDGARRSVWWW